MMGHFIASLCTVLLLASSSIGQLANELVYPEPDPNASTTQLYVGLMMSFGGSFESGGTVPGMQVALDQVNSDPSLLPGYSLHFILTDSQCNRTVSLKNFFKQTSNPPTKIGWIGSGCSLATEPTAEVSHFSNLNQLSCISASPELADRVRFKRYFQLLATDDGLDVAYFGLLHRFGWRQLAIIVQNENIFTRTTDRVKKHLDDANIVYSERMFNTEDGPLIPGKEPFDLDFRIIILSMYKENARPLLCEAHRLGIRYPRYLLITYAWYTDGWWLEGNDTELGCTGAERTDVLKNTLAIQFFEFIADESIFADTGINGSQFLERYNEHLEKSSFANSEDSTDFSSGCYDAVWAFVYALNKTIQDLKDNDTLNALASEAVGLSGEFRMENFTYENNVVADVMMEHLSKTNFLGITGNVSFNDFGIRDGRKAMVYQYRSETNGRCFNESSVLQRCDIGHFLGEEDNFTIVFVERENENTFWPPRDGIGLVPYDGIPIESEVTVAIAVPVIFSLLATAGVVFAAVCLVFNFVFRKRKLIRLTSPNLNYLIGIGAIVLYINVYLYVVPTTDPDASAVLCNLTPCLTSLGYSLCYGTILAKMARVYYIFNNPQMKKRKGFQDWHLTVGVLILVVIDLIILVVYTAVEGARGNFKAARIPKTVNGEDVEGELDVIHHYFVYICDSKSRDITLGILYGLKVILQAIALLFAFSTRNVKVKGVNDAKYIGGAIYVTTIVLTVIIVSTYTLRDYVNLCAVVFGLGLLVGTTMVLVLVFVTKMYRLYKDPHGKEIFTKRRIRIMSSQDLRTLSEVLQDPSTITLESHKTVNALKKRISELESSLRLNSQNGIPSTPTCGNGNGSPRSDLPDARED